MSAVDQSQVDVTKNEKKHLCILMENAIPETTVRKGLQL